MRALGYKMPADDVMNEHVKEVQKRISSVRTEPWRVNDVVSIVSETKLQRSNRFQQVLSVGGIHELCCIQSDLNVHYP